MTGRCRVHYNLRRHDFSIVAGGRVVGHAARVEPDDCEFHVSEAGRRRVLARGQRSVHAWVTGELVDSGGGHGGWRRVSYNPYRAGVFTLDDGTPVDRADRVRFADGHAWLP